MRVTVKYLASLRERLGKSEESVDVPDGTAVADLCTRIVPREGNTTHADTNDDPILAAVNHDYVGRDHELADCDEVAFFPPVTGG